MSDRYGRLRHDNLGSTPDVQDMLDSQPVVVEVMGSQSERLQKSLDEITSKARMNLDSEKICIDDASHESLELRRMEKCTRCIAAVIFEPQHKERNAANGDGGSHQCRKDWSLH